MMSGTLWRMKSACLTLQCLVTPVKGGGDFFLNTFLFPYLHFLSVPAFHMAFQSHSAAATSLPLPFPALRSILAEST